MATRSFSRQKIQTTSFITIIQNPKNKLQSMTTVYHYHPLAEQEIGFKKYFYGVIESVSLPNTVNGGTSKYHCTFKIRDSTSSLDVKLFANDLQQFPPSDAHGWVLRCHRMRIENWNGKMSASTCFSSSWVAFDPKRIPDSLIAPENGEEKLLAQSEQISELKKGVGCSSSISFSASLVDCEMVAKLIKWSRSVAKESSPPSLEGLSYSRKIEEIRLANFFDLWVNILAKDLSLDSHRFYVTVWDGTNFNYPMPKRRMSIPPLEDGTAIELVSVPFSDPEMLSYWHNQIVVGKWAKFRNLIALNQEGPDSPVRVMFSKTSKVELVQESHPHVVNLLAEIGKKRKGNGPFGFKRATETLFPNSPTVTLNFILNCQQTPMKFHCWVRLVSYALGDTSRSGGPGLCMECGSSFRGESFEQKKKLDGREEKAKEEEEEKEITSKEEEKKNKNRKGSRVCGVCGGSDISFELFVKLKLQDSTGTLYAIVAKEDLVDFFSQVHTGVLRGNSESVKLLKRRLDQVVSSQIWMECCIKSYRIPSREVRYRLFSTMILPQ